MKKTNRNDLYITFITLPLYFAAMVKYGLIVLLILICSLSVGMLVELAAARLRKIENITFSVSTWFLLPLVFPPAMPLWMIFISMTLALIIGVIFFGGHEYRLFSPVALGWAFGSLSFTRPMSLGWVYPFPGFVVNKSFWASMVPVVDHPIDFFTARGPIALNSLLMGDFPQPLSNAVPLVTILCGILLILFRVIDLRTVVSYLVTLFVLFLIFQTSQGIRPIDSFDTLLIGNLLFAAFFILPDRRLSARTFSGRWIMGILAAVLTFVIRSFSGFADGVFYAVLLTNIFSALIDEAVLAGKFKGAANENI
ncbi:MAG: RnfABCDGE type electron transport complex subunit D [Spirochaetaceae bacterium]|nr:RnfABCDGE type electron transport complex subunit D [Spirochaetaceae bacterium]